jgi:hypothetical protein
MRSQSPPRRQGLAAPSTPVPRQPVGVSAAIAVGESVPRSAPLPRISPSVPPASPPSRPVPLPPPQSLAAGHAEYRRAWQALLRDLETELASTAEHERAAVADRLQREFPQIVREQEFRELLGRFGLKPRKPGDPELEQWLKSLGKGIFPPGVRLDTGMTIDRLGGLLQMFSQVFVEINAAQNDARKEMQLPGGGRAGSLLSSEDPSIILAYLLNPAVDGNTRLSELEQCVTKLALHEAALFIAIKDAAHALLEELAPEAVAKAEARSTGEDHGMLSRVFGSKQDAGDARLWRRFVTMHADLMDGKQFQRKFMGREFARIYMKAMEKLAPDT